MMKAKVYPGHGPETSVGFGSAVNNPLQVGFCRLKEVLILEMLTQGRRRKRCPGGLFQEQERGVLHAGNCPCAPKKGSLPCQNCGACAPFPHCCPWMRWTTAGRFLTPWKMPPGAFAAPIYFYAMPAHFAALSIGGRGFGRHGKQEYARRLFSP